MADVKQIKLNNTPYDINDNVARTGLTDLIDILSDVKHAGAYVADGGAKLSLSIPLTETESTSVATAFSAIVPEFEGVTELKSGMMVCIKNTKVTSAAASATPKCWTLNIKKSAEDTGFGAKPVYVTTAATTYSTSQFTLNYKMLFIYDEDLNSGNGGWYIGQIFNSDTTYTNVALGQGYGTCTTAAATAAKVVTLSGYTLTVNGIVVVKFDNDVPANATLNINSKGAKAIYYKEAAITAGVIKAGDIATFIYNTNYKLLTIDRWGNDIEKKGNATYYGTYSGNPNATSLNDMFIFTINATFADIKADVDNGKDVTLMFDASSNTTANRWAFYYQSTEAGQLLHFSSLFLGYPCMLSVVDNNGTIGTSFDLVQFALDSNVVHKGDVGSSAEEITADKVFSGNVELGSSLFIDGGASAVVMGNDESDDTLQDLLDGKQAALVSGTNIKTIDSNSLLGSGNIEILPYAGNAMTGSVDAVVTPGFYKTYGTIGASGLLIVNSSIIGRATVITQTRIVNGTVQYRKGTLTNDTVSSWSAWGNILNADNIYYSDSTYSNEHYVVLGDSLNDAITELDDAIFAKSNAIPIIDLT